MNSLKLVKRLWQALPLSDYSRWRLTSLLLEPILPLIKGSVIYTAYLREKEWQAERIRPFYGDSLPPLPPQEKSDIFFWGIIDWRFRFQRPQHLACGFAEIGHRVFFISTSFVNSRRPGFELERINTPGLLYNLRLHLNGRPQVYTAPPSQDDMRRLSASLAALLEWTESLDIVSIVQHPYWYNLCKKIPNCRLIYDCMDHHDGFGNTGKGIAALELDLLKGAEAVVTTSQWLQVIASEHNPNVKLIRNATEYDFFSVKPNQVFQEPQYRSVLGYYGAIAEWMDIELLEKIARHFNDCLLLLVGADECGARQRLGALPNVRFTGEVKYTELPYYLYGMDLCLLPFQVVPLTLATNPVKIYEYLSAGKPVVAINLPELDQFDGLIATADTHEKFIIQIDTMLTTLGNTEHENTRRQFAKYNSWNQRIDSFQAVIENLHEPLISIIILTYNNLELTRACLNTLENFTNYNNLEIIIVDNNSDDGTPDFLRHWSKSGDKRHLILNNKNLGFPAANNQGLAAASGEYLVLLNNDTEVTPGWLRTLMNHLRNDPSLGLIGPVTNNIGNEARIRIRCNSSEEMQRKAKNFTLKHIGETFSIRTLAFFCVMMPRLTYEQVGPLDEAYGLGFFEDDDYCRRIEQTGKQLACAKDVFVHHHLSASFGKLGKGRQELLDHNRKIYEAKWGAWIPHKHR